MKKYLLLFFLALSAMAYSQAPSFGVKAGITSTGMQGDAINNLKDVLDFTNGMVTTGNRTGFFAGAFTSIPISESFSIEPGVYYAQKGYEIKGDLDIKGLEFIGAGARARLQSQYIDLPVLLKGNFGGLQVFAGPQVSYLMQADLKSSAGVFGINLLNHKMNVTEQFNKLDAGIIGGIGFQFANGLNISAAYEKGLTRLDTDRNTDTYNHGFKVGIGYSF